jgi:hypothetical protein
VTVFKEIGVGYKPPFAVLFYLLNGVILRGVVYYDDVKAGVLYLIY